MDVDAPNILKRCSSAPLINEVPCTTVNSPTTRSIPREVSCFNMFSNSNQQRTRRFSASYSPRSPNAFPPRYTPRVNQLRQEECAEVQNSREAAHEKDLHTAMQMSQSCEDLTLTLSLGGGASPPACAPARMAVSPSPPAGAPARMGVSPSPTRVFSATRRSLSPIMRPAAFSPNGRPSSLLGTKRKVDMDESPSAKRCCRSDGGMDTPSTPGTPESYADSGSGFTFRPVSPRGPQPMHEGPSHSEDNHKAPSPS